MFCECEKGWKWVDSDTTLETHGKDTRSIVYLTKEKITRTLETHYGSHSHPKCNLFQCLPSRSDTTTNTNASSDCGPHFSTSSLQNALHSLFSDASSYVLISDTRVGEIWQPAVTESLEAYLNEFLVSPQSDKCINARSTSPIQTFCIPAGEGAKCRQVRDALEDFLVASRCDRQCVLVALGGGVVGDLVGFVASTFLRGVRWVYVPTSLLSMVDSSVGGKTAINSAAGKNLFGSFYPAHLTLVSISFLGTLSVRELRNGFAEVVKSALLCGKTSFFDQVELLAPSLRSAESARRIPDSVWHEIILQSISLKMLLIQGDLTESQNGSRCLLNLGHTVGHALEYTYDLLHSSYERRSNAKFGCLGSTYTDTSYSDQVPSPDYLLHGEAVSIGLVAEGRISRRLGILQPSLLQRMQHVLTSCGLPITSPSSLFFEDHYEEFSFREKKHDSNLSRFI